MGSCSGRSCWPCWPVVRCGVMIAEEVCEQWWLGGGVLVMGIDKMICYKWWGRVGNMVVNVCVFARSLWGMSGFVNVWNFWVFEDWVIEFVSVVRFECLLGLGVCVIIEWVRVRVLWVDLCVRVLVCEILEVYSCASMWGSKMCVCVFISVCEDWVSVCVFVYEYWSKCVFA